MDDKTKPLPAKDWTRTTIIMTSLTLLPLIAMPLSQSLLTTGTEADLLLIPLSFMLSVILAVLLIGCLTFDFILARRYLTQNRPRGYKLIFPSLVIILAVAAPIWLAFSLR